MSGLQQHAVVKTQGARRDMETGHARSFPGLTSSYACRLALRFALVIILSGPSGPKLRADGLVASEKVGEGGPGDIVRLDEIANDLRERARGIVVWVG